MPSLWFIVPAHGRADLARICLRQLRRTCDALSDEGIDASAVVIADDENLDTARELGFGTVYRDNRFLSRRFNDGIQLACDPQFNRRPADFVVPCGSDDWIDHRIIRQALPGRREVVGFQRMAFVREDGREISRSFIAYPGGCGVRIYPRQIMARIGYRPADEDRPRGCDTSILTNVRAEVQGVRVLHADVHDWQIVDWKSRGVQINSYDDVRKHREDIVDDPFEVLADVFPAEALEEMRAHYGLTRELVA